jgi:hypothetical protein
MIALQNPDALLDALGGADAPFPAIDVESPALLAVPAFRLKRRAFGSARAGGGFNAGVLVVRAPAAADADALAALVARAGADDTDGLEGVVDGINFGVVTIDAQTVAENDRSDVVPREVRDEVVALGPDPEDFVAAAGDHDDGRAGVGAPGREMHLDARVVDVERALDFAAVSDAAGGAVVGFGFVESFAF